MVQWLGPRPSPAGAWLPPDQGGEDTANPWAQPKKHRMNSKVSSSDGKKTLPAELWKHQEEQRAENKVKLE